MYRHNVSMFGENLRLIEVCSGHHRKIWFEGWKGQMNLSSNLQWRLHPTISHFLYIILAWMFWVCTRVFKSFYGRARQSLYQIIDVLHWFVASFRKTCDFYSHFSLVLLAFKEEQRKAFAVFSRTRDPCSMTVYYVTVTFGRNPTVYSYFSS